MRILVCGGRKYNNDWAWNHVISVLSEIHHATPISAIIQGDASGADFLAKCWAGMYRVKCITVPALWEEHGKSAGPIRNKRMLTEFKPDLVIAFPGGQGTADMVRQAKEHGVKVRLEEPQ